MSDSSAINNTATYFPDTGKKGERSLTLWFRTREKFTLVNFFLQMMKDY
jgi:hypothetical protein